MDKNDVRGRLNQHLKRKLQPTDSPGPTNSKQASPSAESIIVSTNNSTTNLPPLYQHQSSPSSSHQAPTPQPTTTNTPTKRSPRKAALTSRNSRRQAVASAASNNECSSASNSTHTTPSVTPVSRSMTATPIGCDSHHHASTADGGGQQQDAVGSPSQTTSERIQDKHQDILSAVLTEKRLSMFHDPEVVDFLNTIMQSLGTK